MNSPERTPLKIDLNKTVNSKNIIIKILKVKSVMPHLSFYKSLLVEVWDNLKDEQLARIFEIFYC